MVLMVEFIVLMEESKHGKGKGTRNFNNNKVLKQKFVGIILHSTSLIRFI